LKVSIKPGEESKAAVIAANPEEEQ